mgnify:CR=1 FL=1
MIAVIGAGVVGLACARALAQAGLEVVIAERETHFGTGVSSRSSEVTRQASRLRADEASGRPRSSVTSSARRHSSTSSPRSPGSTPTTRCPAASTATSPSPSRSFTRAGTTVSTPTARTPCL